MEIFILMILSGILATFTIDSYTFINDETNEGMIWTRYIYVFINSYLFWTYKELGIERK